MMLSVILKEVNYLFFLNYLNIQSEKIRILPSLSNPDDSIPILFCALHLRIG
jgi:hypothetical protein